MNTKDSCKISLIIEQSIMDYKARYGSININRFGLVKYGCCCRYSVHIGQQEIYLKVKGNDRCAIYVKGDRKGRNILFLFKKTKHSTVYSRFSNEQNKYLRILIPLLTENG